MDHRLLGRRRTWLFAIFGTALAPFIAGCQSNAQQDLIARELRMQEDQLYAMEHYLEQYQQLVCKYRSENAALRRRMADDYYDETNEELPQLRPAPRTPAGVRPAPGGPVEAPISPPREGLGPDVPAIELPEVPPLEGSTQDASAESEVVTASYEEPVSDDEPAAKLAAQAATELTDLYEIEPAITTSDVEPTLEPPVNRTFDAEFSPLWLHGEVVENDTGGGPRLTVNVDHFDELGNHSLFEGTLSLMLMATSGDGSQKSLARWDFSAEDVSGAAIDAAFEPTMRFHLELPADTPLDESTQLWVRLVPAEGAKLLAHTAIELTQPGSFSSRAVSPALDEASDSAVLAINDAEAPVSVADDAVESTSDETPSIGSRIAVNIVGSDWTIARPNEPANLPAEPAPGGGWRASTEIIPTVVQSKPASPTKKPHYNVRPAGHTETVAAPPAPPAYQPPTWSPDRASPADRNEPKSSAVARRPAWSATR